MQTFTEHYFQEKFTSDIRRALTSNLLKKRTTGVDVGKGRYKNLIQTDSSIFNKIKEEIRHEVVRVYNLKRKDKKEKNSMSSKEKIKKEFGKIYVVNALEGEIDSGEDKLEGNAISTIVYELNNGGKIAFITTEDSDGMLRKYIATGSKGNDFFREKLGTTLQQIYADSKRSSKLISKGPTVNPYTEIEKIIKNINPYEEDDIESNKEYGAIDISKDDFINLIKFWGSGKRSKYGSDKPFAGKFVRQLFYNSKNDYKGYKYLNRDGNEVVYLMDTGDGENYFIAFDGKNSYNWAKYLGLLKYSKIYPGKTTINWQKGNFEELE
jgi:hypothetical protein